MCLIDLGGGQKGEERFICVSKVELETGKKEEGICREEKEQANAERDIYCRVKKVHI